MRVVRNDSAFGVFEGFQAHHHVRSQAAECHDLLWGSGASDFISLAFQPHQKLLGLICPG